MSAFFDAQARIRGLDEVARQQAIDRHARLLKPPGSLGRLESLGAHLAAITGECPPAGPDPVVVVVFAGDHGVVRQGVTAWPQEITAAMVGAMAAGRAAVSVLARMLGVELLICDVGVAHPLPSSAPALHQVVERRVVSGTHDLSEGPAMSGSEAEAALDVGAELAAEAVGHGARCLVTGEMGIGNTTAASALAAALIGLPAEEVTGRGAGLDDAALAVKTEVVRRALARVRDKAGADPDPLLALQELGGVEIGAVAGFVVGGAAAGVPVVIDGFIAGAATLLAARLAPGAAARCVAAHRSAEPGATAVLEALDLEPLLDLGLRLGEASGALLAIPLLRAATTVLREMGTIDEVSPG